MYTKLYSSLSLFKTKKDIHYNIRERLIFEIYLCRKDFLLFSILKIWNNINSNIKINKT